MFNKKTYAGLVEDTEKFKTTSNNDKKIEQNETTSIISKDTPVKPSGARADFLTRPLPFLSQRSAVNSVLLKLNGPLPRCQTRKHPLISWLRIPARGPPLRLGTVRSPVI